MESSSSSDEALAMTGELPLTALSARHSEGQHFVVSDGEQYKFVTLPLKYAASAENGELCFTDHRPKNVAMDLCCKHESEHVHAHLHRDGTTTDVLLEQCLEGCGLPALRELKGLYETVIHQGGEDHEHREGCGHSQITHGDHKDWLVPQKDGSYKLGHQQVHEGRSSFIEHGRLVKRGITSLAKINLGPAIVEVLSYESAGKKGYECIPQLSGDEDEDHADSFQIVEEPLPDDNCTLLPCSSVGRNVVQEGMSKVDIPANYTALCNTTLDVMGICCPSEVPLIKKLLNPLPGVEEVSVNVTAKTVNVLHDRLLVTDVHLVKVLNGAHLEASIHQRGQFKAGRKWPSPWCLGSGVLVAIAFFHYIYEPLKWVALGAVAVGVPPLLWKSLTALRQFFLDINVLMLIAVSGAIALGDYLEAGTIVFLFSLAEWLESRSTDKARSAIAAVVERAPQSATLLDGGARVRVEDVKVGTLLAIKAGDTIPIDGQVVTGRGFVDESSLTGESVPVEKEEGATVWAGTMNLSGYVTMKTTSLSVDSAVARMVRLVEEAQNQRSKTEMLVEKIAKYYTPAVVIAALVVGIVPWASGVHNPKHYVYLALVLLVVSCPCALVISTPVVVTCGIAQAARLGLLVKGGTFLEILGRLKVVALDKTGTLTEGQFSVSNMLPIAGTSTPQQILYWVTSVENKASHPLAAALVSYARLHGVEPSEDVRDFEVIAGEGVSAVVDDHIVQIGNARMAARLGWVSAAAIETLANWSNSGATVGWIGLDGIAIGIFSVGDQLRPEAAEAVRGLKKLGIRVAMLTGDSTAAASYVHDKIGEIDVFAELLPEDKVRKVQDLKEHGVLAMVGDGINDAPALAAADVGIAMGVAGSAVAMETADVALMTNDLRKLVAAVRLGLNCRWKIGQNVTFSFVTKVLIIGLAAGGYASLWAAVIADVGTCLAVIFNSMRILKKVKQNAGQDQCVARKLDQEFKKNCDDIGCCEKERSKKDKCEDVFCCDDKDDQPPCCSSARCEKTVLTARGRPHRHGNKIGGFYKTTGEDMRTASQACEGQCCSDIPAAPIDQPKLPDCGSSRNFFLPGEKLVHNVELVQKLPAAGIGATKLPSGCCSKGSCKSSEKKAVSPAVEVMEASGANAVIATKPPSGCCSSGSCKSSNKKTASPAVEMLEPSGSNSTIAAKPLSGCCSKGSCKSSEKKTALPAVETMEPSGSSTSVATKPPSGCCASGSCKSSNKKTSLPAVEVMEASGANSATATKPPSRCCSKGSCKSSEKKTASPAVEVMDASGANAIIATKPQSGCCSKGSCKSSEKKTASPAVEMMEPSGSNATTATKPPSGCCSSGSCKSSDKKTASPAVEMLEPSESNASRATKPPSGCCASGSCKSSNKKTASPAVETTESSGYSATVATKPPSGCCASGSCKSSNKTTSAPATETTNDSGPNTSNL